MPHVKRADLARRSDLPRRNAVKTGAKTEGNSFPESILGWTTRGKAAVNAPQSKRFARCGYLGKTYAHASEWTDAKKTVNALLKQIRQISWQAENFASTKVK
jgi:hypothetical protein